MATDTGRTNLREIWTLPVSCLPSVAAQHRSGYQMLIASELLQNAGKALWYMHVSPFGSPLVFHLYPL